MLSTTRFPASRSAEAPGQRQGHNPRPVHKAIFHFKQCGDHPEPKLSFGSFLRSELEQLPGLWGGDVEFFALRPAGGTFRKGQAGKKGHCLVNPLNSPFGLLLVHSAHRFHVVAVLRGKCKWNTALEKELSTKGETLIDFFHQLRTQLAPQRRGSVDYSDGKALLAYGWCYFSTWNQGCIHKKSFTKDKENGNCSLNLLPEMWGLKPGHSLTKNEKLKYRTFLKELAWETGFWVERHLPQTSQIRPAAAAQCTHSPHFTTFSLAFDAKQFTHRDVHNQSFTNILNFSDPGTTYYLGLANYCLEECDQSCGHMALGYKDSQVCSIFSQDHDHFVDRDENPQFGRRVALLFYSHNLKEEFHGQVNQILLWKNVITIRKVVLARMEREGRSERERSSVKAKYNRLLLGVKHPCRAMSEAGCLELMSEMQSVKNKRDVRFQKKIKD